MMLALTIIHCAGLQVPASTNSAAAAPALSRRAVLSTLALAPLPALAASPADVLDDLPPKAKQAYLQYLPQLQLDADYFIFELFPLLKEPGKYDRITGLTSSTDIGSDRRCAAATCTGSPRRRKTTTSTWSARRRRTGTQSR